MQLFMKTLTGKHLWVDVETSDTMGEVKKKLQAKEGIPAELIRFIMGGKQLDDQNTVLEYGLHKDYPLHIVLRLRNSVDEEKPQT